MTNFEVGDHVKFAGGRGEITKIEERPNDGHLLHVYTSEGQLRKLPSGLPHIEKLDSLVDRLAAGQSDPPLLFDLRERAIRLDLAYNLHGGTLRGCRSEYALHRTRTRSSGIRT